MAAANPSDPGLFGPDSVTWRIHADPSMMVGGLRALLVQALNPRAMAAVAQHSNYREQPWERLMRTGHYIVKTTFGDTATAHDAAARVRSIHRHISGVDDFTGAPYRADDPELLLWIHCVEVHSFMTGYRTYGGGLEEAEIDRYVREMVAAAELVGLHADDVPRTYRDLRDYLNGQEMVASPAARDGMRFVLFPPVPWPGGRYPNFPGSRILVVPGRAAWAVPSAAAVAILPERARKEYGLPYLRPLVPSLRISLIGFHRAMRMIAGPPPGIEELQAAVGSAA
ncbi:MAG: oxygenase MpaB family protein [Actinomycetota bacterium]